MRSNNDVICKYCGWGISHHSPNCGQIQSLELQLAEARKELAACREENAFLLGWLNKYRAWFDGNGSISDLWEDPYMKEKNKS